MISNEEHDYLVSRVFAYDYYLDIFHQVLDEYTRKGIHSTSVSFWNDFWLALPDSPAIHRDPFYDICDIAERIFEDED